MQRQTGISDAATTRKRSPKAPRLRLRLLATTDLHMHILPYDYMSDQPNVRWGLSQTAKLIQEARMEERNSLLFDAGDFLHGTAMGDYVVDHAQDDPSGATPEVHPMIAAMNHLGYDVVTLGNHDFDRGVGVLLSAIEQAEFPIVSANTVLKQADEPQRDSTFVPPYTILNRTFIDDQGARHTLRIGVIGFLPPNSIHAGDGQNQLPGTRDIIEAAKGFVPRLRAKGVDLVVALAHSGIGPSGYRKGMENALVPLCEIPGIDVVIGGHSHQCFPHPNGGPNPAYKTLDQADVDAHTGVVHGKPVVIAGFWGSHLGLIDLELEATESGWTLCQSNAELRDVPESAPDPERSTFSALLGQLHESTLMHVRTRIGYAHQNLHSFFSLIGVDPATQLVQQAMVEFTLRLIEEGAAPRLPVLASSAAFKCGGLGGPEYYTSIPAGDLTLRSVSDLYIFPNELGLVRASGAYLRNWLERAASVFRQIEPGRRGQVLKEASTPGYLLEAVLGLSYQIDLSQPARFTTAGQMKNPDAVRISKLTYQGVPVQDEDEFLLATSDFRIRGGGGFPMIDPTRIIPVKPISIRDLLRHFIEEQQSIQLVPNLHWRFAPIQGASVIFPSSPKGQDHLSEAGLATVQLCQERDAAGFSLYEMLL